MAIKEAILPTWAWMLLAVLVVGVMYDGFKILRWIFFKLKASKSAVPDLDDIEGVTDDK